MSSVWNRKKEMVSNSGDPAQVIKSFEASAPRRLFGRTSRLHIVLLGERYASTLGIQEARSATKLPVL
ncbi:hypothetical protein KC19_VG180700 [Ceratodon purpureus]|uniref:Uncharacterized protein n=1 Tax=Ceratodon purpureus TaxID=3225 RepID=A0A8T0HRW3_CERPU|nr:hypothetical protein KC19_VG180700 [Ceratodon purpureus]